ncbi:MAG: hypothetical protein Q8S17_10725 [Humidesulfovibrio sp.]|nr:hypothetical protein [Humidesulfovibrio sp.]
MPHIKKELRFRFGPERAYRLSARQWLDNMGRLKANHPRLFMTAARRNPFRKPKPD